MLFILGWTKRRFQQLKHVQIPSLKRNYYGTQMSVSSVRIESGKEVCQCKDVMAQFPAKENLESILDKTAHSLDSHVYEVLDL